MVHHATPPPVGLREQHDVRAARVWLERDGPTEAANMQFICSLASTNLQSRLRDCPYHHHLQTPPGLPTYFFLKPLLGFRL